MPISFSANLIHNHYDEEQSFSSHLFPIYLPEHNFSLWNESFGYVAENSIYDDRYLSLFDTGQKGETWSAWRVTLEFDLKLRLL